MQECRAFVVAYCTVADGVSCCQCSGGRSNHRELSELHPGFAASQQPHLDRLEATMPSTPGYDTFLLIYEMRSSPLPGVWVFCPSNGVLLESGRRSRHERTTVQYSSSNRMHHSSRYTSCFSRRCKRCCPPFQQYCQQYCCRTEGRVNVCSAQVSCGAGVTDDGRWWCGLGDGSDFPHRRVAISTGSDMCRSSNPPPCTTAVQGVFTPPLRGWPFRIFP